jgi:predicted regulator of Ras-like GTPase activity (Roadblock/LC7/MglB family)
MFPAMDANEALDQLLRVSEDLRAAVIFEREGTLRVLGSATLLEEDARELAARGRTMLAYADRLRDSAEVRQLEAVTPEGAVYVVRDGDRAVLAIAGPDALAGLVQHDLRSLLGSLSRRRRKAKAHAAT